MKKVVFFLLLLGNTLNAQISHQGHVRIIDSEGAPVICKKIFFVNTEGVSRNAKCPYRSGCCIPGNCNGLETILIEPQNTSYFAKQIEFGCLSQTFTVFSKTVINNMEVAANKHLDNDEKLKSIKYYKNLAFTYNRTGNYQKALEKEQKSYTILSNYLLGEKSDSLISVENNELIIDEKLRQAIKDYQIKNNLKIINGEFTSEMADSFKGNDNLFLKDQVFMKKN